MVTDESERLIRRMARAGVVLAAIALSPAVSADLDIGDRAPEFALEGSDGKVHRLSEYRGTSVVLAWFPKAFTGG